MPLSNTEFNKLIVLAAKIDTLVNAVGDLRSFANIVLTHADPTVIFNQDETDAGFRTRYIARYNNLKTDVLTAYNNLP